MATALISALTERMVRREIAMTGEITLRGNVLAIGGLKEKLLAARRGGISLVVIPQENEKDLSEIPQEVYAGMVIKPVGHMDEVTALAITGGAVSIPSSGLHKTQEVASDTVTAH